MYQRPPEQAQNQTEVYFPNWGWMGLDSTPDQPLLNPDPRQLAQLQQQQLAHLPPVEQIYRSMLANLSKQGLSKRPAQTQLEYADSASKIYHPQIAKVVWEISQLYTAWRYGKQKIDIKQLAKKLQDLQHLQQLAAQRQRQKWLANLKSQWGFK